MTSESVGVTPARNSDPLGSVPEVSNMDKIDVDEIVMSLQQRVAKRRASVDYPPGLEAQLESEFALIMAAVHRPEMTTRPLDDRIRTLLTSVHSVGAEPGATSRLPGGGIVHRTSGRLVRRHTTMLADEVRRIGADTASALDEVRALIEHHRAADERQLLDVVGSIYDRIAVLDHLADVVLDLEQRIMRLEAQSPRT